MPDKPLLSLTCILKNESSNVAAILESCRGIVDHYTILDTGSTDGTQAIIRNSNIPGIVYEEPFVGFATTRNRVLDLEAARPDAAEFCLMLSGDEVLKDAEGLRDFLSKAEKDGYGVKLLFDEFTALHTTRITRTGSPWKYESDLPSELHEIPVSPNCKSWCDGVVPKLWIKHDIHDANRRNQTIYERELPLLEEAIAENPNNAHILLFLAQAHENVAPFFDPGTCLTHQMMAMSMYLRRINIGGGVEDELNWVRMRFLDIAKSIPNLFTPEESLNKFNELCEIDPNRPETHLLRAICSYKVLPAVKVLDYALAAARVAAASTGVQTSFPINVSCEWRAWGLAASCARQLSRHDATFKEKLAEYIANGLAAGGPKQAFDEFSKPLA